MYHDAPQPSPYEAATYQRADPASGLLAVTHESWMPGQHPPPVFTRLRLSVLHNGMRATLFFGWVGREVG